MILTMTEGQKKLPGYFARAFARVMAMLQGIEYGRWDHYLTSCAGAFENATVDVTQITVSRSQ